MTETVEAPETNVKPAVEAPEEPGEFGVIGFTNVSPNTGARKQYVALKTPIGWQIAGGGQSGRIPHVTSYDVIVDLADEGSIVVLGELPTPAQPKRPAHLDEAPSGTATVAEDDEDDFDEINDENDD